MGFWYAGELLQNLNLTYEGCSVRLIGKIKLLINPLHGTPTPYFASIRMCISIFDSFLMYTYGFLYKFYDFAIFLF